MGKYQQILSLLLIPVISIMLFQGIIFAEPDGITDAKNKTVSCGEGTRYIPEDKTCVSICKEGTIFKNNECVAPVPLLGGSDTDWIGWGVLLAAIIAGIGIGFTFVQQRKETQKRTQELIQTYSRTITEIASKESTLKTKQDCALYSEQYLDALEEIATLALEGNLNKGIFSSSYEHVTSYFNNNFAYGMDLWWWYHKYIHGLNDEIQNKIWSATRVAAKLDRDIIFEDLFINEEIDSMKKEGKELGVRRSFKAFKKDDRWPAFRKLCAANEIEEFDYDYIGLNGKSKDEWRVLPDIMYYDFNKIPDEDGLTKAELVEIIRPFANDLSGFIEQEKYMESPEQFEVYAEQYLETLEQIATLYRNKIIPEKAKEYFENKFSYGCNLWNWYHHRVLNFSEKLHKALWNTDSPKTKLDDVFTKEQLAIMTEEEKEKAKPKKKSVLENTYAEFIKFYSKDDNFIHEDPDVWKLIKQEANSFDQEIQDKIEKIIAYNAKKIKPKKTIAYELGQRLVKLRQEKKSTTAIENLTKTLDKAENDLKTAIMDIDVPKDWDYKKISPVLKEFVYNFLVNERWKDFRWWCRREGITPFHDDPTEGLILPLKMWYAQYK